MGWSIDNTAWNILREKMKGTFAGLSYSMATSLSPVVVHHRGKLTGKEMVKYARLFPKDIRVEFQEVDWEGEIYHLYGRGDFLMYGGMYGTYPVPINDVSEKMKQG